MLLTCPDPWSHERGEAPAGQPEHQQVNDEYDRDGVIAGRVRAGTHLRDGDHNCYLSSRQPGANQAAWPAR